MTKPADMKLIDGAAHAIRRLNDAGIWVGVVTNQRGVALGLMTLDELDAVNARLYSELDRDGSHLDAMYVCQHERGTCMCRKPLPGLLLHAQKEIRGLDFQRAAIIGDSRSDIEAGRAVGAATILIGSAGGNNGADYQAASLAQALDLLSVPPLAGTSPARPLPTGARRRVAPESSPPEYG